MDIASVLKIISYIGYIFFAVFAVLTVTIFVKYDIRNVFGFLSGHVAAKRIAEMEHSSGTSGNFSQSRVKSNSLFRKNSGKNDSTNRLKTDFLVKESNSQVTEKLEKKSFLYSHATKEDDRKTEPLDQQTEVLLQEKTEPLDQRTEVLQQEKTEPLVPPSGFSSDARKIDPYADTVLLKDPAGSVRDFDADHNEDDFQTEVLSVPRGAEESLTEVLGIDAGSVSELSKNDINSEIEKHKTIHNEVAPGFIVEKEIMLTHSSDCIPRS